MPSESKSDCRFGRRSWTSSGGFSRQGGVPPHGGTSDSNARDAPFADHVFKRCIAHGSNKETVRSTPSSRPRWLMRLHARQADLRRRCYRTYICISPPWLERPKTPDDQSRGDERGDDARGTITP